MEAVIEKLKGRFTIIDSEQTLDWQYYISINKDDALSILAVLRDIYGFSHLAFLTAVDLIEDGKFELVYMLHNYETKIDLGVKVKIDREPAVMDSIHSMWVHAATYQRELYEMFGIEFPGSPRMTESFMLEGWDLIPPMRREFDTKAYSEQTFYPREGRSSIDPVEYMDEQLNKFHKKKNT